MFGTTFASKSRRLSFLTACVVLVSCRAPGTYTTVTLAAGSPPDVTAGLRLLAVNADGTAHIEWPATGRVSVLRPNTATNMISIWTLDSTDPVAQRARLSVQHRCPPGFRCWPYDPVQILKGEGREFTPADLAQIARAHAKREGVATVDYTNSCPLIYVFDKPRPMLAQVHWGRGLGEPCLIVEIDRRGEVIRHVVAVAVCGTGEITVFKDRNWPVDK
jgi:hypothetical protein